MPNLPKVIQLVRGELNSGVSGPEAGPWTTVLSHLQHREEDFGMGRVVRPKVL